MGNDDRRRTIPRTDALLALPAVVEARARLSEPTVRAVISSAQQAARDGALPVEQVAEQYRAPARSHNLVLI